MIKKIFLITIISILFTACGVKSKPEHKSQYNLYKTTQLV